MTAGGRRPGAGRPIKLEWDTRMAIGAECEKIQAESKIDRTVLVDQRVRRVPDDVLKELRKRQAALHALPLGDRKAVLQMVERGNLLDDGENKEIEDSAEALSAVQVALDGRSRGGLSAMDVGGPSMPSGRWFKFKRRRATNRKDIIRDVADRWTERTRKAVGTRYVTACWVEYRQMLRRLEKDRENSA